MRERLEEHVEDIISVYVDGLAAQRALVSQRDGIVGYEPDHQVRLHASRDWLDRVFGRPKQMTELSGSFTLMDIAVDE